ncbi:MAG: AmmeMemoRadiSam system radical SAM enzyme [Candidatus Geothermincolia bacterium]
MKEALFYHRTEQGKLLCELCPKYCVISEGKRGFCYARVNQGGVLYSEIYGRAMAAAMDPIEKKPLYHFHPGSSIFSIGTRGCNQRCDFCQNYHMLSGDAPLEEISVAWAVDKALEAGSVGIAYTYNEPLIWYEFLAECAPAARARGLKNVLVTNGFVNPEPFRELAPHIDAMNIDIKSMEESFYRDICRSELAPVLETCRAARAGGIHLEITNLVIPTLNDSDEQFRELAAFVAELGRDVPLHLSAYYPCYKMTIPATPLETLRRGAAVARRVLDYVYLGNVRGDDGSNTLCPRCGNILVQRDGYSASLPGLAGKDCANCGRHADMIL